MKKYFYLAFVITFFSALPLVEAAKIWEYAPKAEGQDIKKKLAHVEEQVKELRASLDTEKTSQGFIKDIQDKKPISLFINNVTDDIRTVMSYMVASFDFISHIPEMSLWIGKEFLNPSNYLKMGWFLLKFLASLSVCLGLFFLVNRLIRLITPKQKHKKHLFISIIAYISAYITFPYFAYISFSALESDIYLRDLVFLLGLGVTLTLMIIHLSQLLLEPYRPEQRVFELHDRYSLLLHKLVKQFSIIGIGGYFLTQALRHLNMPVNLYENLLQSIAFVLSFSIIIWVLRYKSACTDLLIKRLQENPPVMPLWRRVLVKLWPIAVIVLVIAIYLDFCAVINDAQSFIVRLLLISFIGLIVAFLEDKIYYIRTHLFQRAIHVYYPKVENSLESYSKQIDSLMSWVIYGLGSVAVLEVCGFEVIASLSSPALQIIVQKLLVISFITFMVFTALRMGNFLFEKYSRGIDKSRDHSSARVVTVIAILRNSLRVGLWVPAIFLILSELGFDITPLVASVSIFSVAIGFGAQTLVKDVITGLFIILEDTVSVGDYVTLDGLTGNVEALTIRTIALRAEDGTLHTIPFSSITRVSNLTRQYAYVVANVVVSYQQNIPAVIDALKDAFASMRQEKKWAALILGDLEIKGLDSFDEKGLVVKVLIKTVVLKHSDVRREFNQRIKGVFDERGIIMTHTETPRHFHLYLENNDQTLMFKAEEKSGV